MPSRHGKIPAAPVEKAIWFVENRFAGDLSLADIADVAGVSRYRMSRAFGPATGYSPMAYVRARRLSEAARALAGGAPDILAVALDAGYGSHEAFTRAFRDQFGLTPEAVRAQRHVDNLDLVEPIRMDKSLIVDLDPPRFETAKPFRVAGIGQRYRFESNQGIPMQWQRFVPHLGNLAGQVGRTTYGVCWNGRDDASYEYVAGVEVSSFAGLPPELSRVEVPAGRYAVFSHRGHISTMRATADTIWNKWLPGSRQEVAESPSFERYTDAFDSRTGNGVVEIWVPVKA